VVIPFGFEKLPVNLNEGGQHKGEKVWLMFRRDAASSAITDIGIVEDAEPARTGYRKIGGLSCSSIFSHPCPGCPT
jgi:hypothetical protein